MELQPSPNYDGQWCLAMARQAGLDKPLIAEAAAEVLGLAFSPSLNNRPISNDFVTFVPISFARRHSLIGLAGDNGTMDVVLADLAQLRQAQAVARMLNGKIRVSVAPQDEILRAVNAAYQQRAGQAEQLIDQLDGDKTIQKMDNRVFRQALVDYEAAVTAGRDVAAPLEASGVFSQMVVQIVAVGQQAGRLEDMLQQFSESYDQQVATAAQRLTAVLEPLLIVLLAGLIGFIAFATILLIMAVSNAL